MKRLIKLLLILPLLFIVSISAKEIDMNGEPFADDKIYESGDIYKNVRIINHAYAFFYTYDEDLLYNTSLITETEESPTNTVGYTRFYNTFYPKSFNGSENIFGLQYNVPTPFLIPYYHNSPVLWVYYDYHSSYNPETHEFSRIPTDVFHYFMNKPYYTVECVKSVKYGESTSCDLYLNFEQYGNDGDADDLMLLLIDANFIFKVSSNDYELYNVRINEDTRFTYNDGIVSGQLFDFSSIRQYKEIYGSGNEEIAIKIAKEFQKYGELTNSCTGNIDLSVFLKSSLGTRDVSTCLSKNKYKIKVLTLDITPLNNETKDGIINLSDMDLDLSGIDPEGNINRVSGTMNEMNTIVPMIGEVKGVEENPKTGLFNYLLLIIPIALLGIGFNLLRKIRLFKKI